MNLDLGRMVPDRLRFLTDSNDVTIKMQLFYPEKHRPEEGRFEVKETIVFRLEFWSAG